MQSTSGDDITFANRLYREMFDEYYSSLRALPAKEDERQSRIFRHFDIVGNQAWSSCAMDLLVDPHQLTVKVFKEAIEPEVNRLGEIVPKSILIYKCEITKQQCAAVSKQILEAQKAGDKALEQELAAKLVLLGKVRNAFSREVNRL